MEFICKNQQVVLGLSGGVDSAVAALLLRDAGADVHALHMTNWEDDEGYCRAAEDLQDARRICDQLKIPLHHANFARQYRDRVFAYFLDEYRRGRTPNPDILCNREIKFGVFREYAKRLGGEWLATGHYARREAWAGSPALFKGADRNKDQSYFLHAIESEALAETLFPLGSMDKSEVRAIAREQGLAVHDKKDSTGICFIGERPFREFLRRYLPAQPGPIRTICDETIGEHHGLMFYTLGQRQGLGIGGLPDADEAAWYVVDKRPEQNALIVDQGDSALLYSHVLQASSPHWIGQAPIDLERGFACNAKIRYRQDDQRCLVRSDSHGRLLVEFDMAQRAAAPGQFVVFYADDRCLGGAVIDAVLDSGRERPMARAVTI